MMVTVLCGGEDHPVVAYIKPWIREHSSSNHSFYLAFDHEKVAPGGVLFVLSYGRILSPKFIQQFEHVVVLHASDLPQGRGWSPHVWELLAGAPSITLSAISAADKVDAGDIWAKMKIDIEPTDVFKEINQKLFSSEVAMMDRVLTMIDRGESPIPQREEAVTYYPRRMPEDSQVQLEDSLSDIFNLLRIADPQRYPVYLYKNGVKFNLYLEKADETC